MCLLVVPLLSCKLNFLMSNIQNRGNLNSNLIEECCEIIYVTIKNSTYCSHLRPIRLCILFCGCIFGIVLCISLRFCIWILEDHKMCLCSQAFQTHPTYHDSRSSHHIFCPLLRKDHHRICDHSLGTYDSLIQRNKRKMAINITTNETVNDQ